MGGKMLQNNNRSSKFNTRRLNLKSFLYWEVLAQEKELSVKNWSLIMDWCICLQGICFREERLRV